MSIDNEGRGPTADGGLPTDGEPPEGDDGAHVVNMITAAKREADSARLTRIIQNRQNYDTYHLRQDWSHKQKGQSREFLPKVRTSVEQIRGFITKGLADLGFDWYTMEFQGPAGEEPQRITVDAAKIILDRQLEKAEFYLHLGDSIWFSVLSGVGVVKTDIEWRERPRYVARKKEKRETPHEPTHELVRDPNKRAQLRFFNIPHRDWYPDPTGRRVYTIERIEQDLHQVRSLILTADNPLGIFDEATVLKIVSDTNQVAGDEAYRARETGQNVAQSAYRKCVQIDEFWGTILNPDGTVFMDNAVAAIANERYLVRAPEENPFWHKEDPYVVFAPLRVPRSVHHAALMEAPVKLNLALNEMFNLMLDNGLVAVFGTKQLRMNWLEDPSQVNDGVKPNQTLRVNEQCPPGATVLERVDTADMSPVSLQVFESMSREYQQASWTDDFRMGSLPQREVKATEVVAVQQTISGMLDAVCKVLESEAIPAMLRKAWMVCMQHLDDFDEDEVRTLLGRERAETIAKMAPQERFAETCNGLKFHVTGLSETLNKGKQWQKLGEFLQTVFANPVLAQEFAREMSASKTLGLILKDMGINAAQLKLDDEHRAENALGGAGPSVEQDQAMQLKALQAAGPPGAPGLGGGPGGPPGLTPGPGTPNGMSQIGKIRHAPPAAAGQRAQPGPPTPAGPGSPPTPPSKAGKGLVR